MKLLRLILLNIAVLFQLISLVAYTDSSQHHMYAKHSNNYEKFEKRIKEIEILTNLSTQNVDIIYNLSHAVTQSHLSNSTKNLHKSIMDSNIQLQTFNVTNIEFNSWNFLINLKKDVELFKHSINTDTHSSISKYSNFRLDRSIKYIEMYLTSYPYEYEDDNQINFSSNNSWKQSKESNPLFFNNQHSIGIVVFSSQYPSKLALHTDQ